MNKMSSQFLGQVKIPIGSIAPPQGLRIDSIRFCCLLFMILCVLDPSHPFANAVTWHPLQVNILDLL